jgi:WD40 repeat protein
MPLRDRSAPPRGTVLAGYASGAARLWNVVWPAPPRWLASTAPVVAVDVSRDGLTALTTGADGGLIAWDLSAAQPTNQAQQRDRT